MNGSGTKSGGPKRRSSRRGRSGHEHTERVVDYHNLKNPFPRMKLFSDDRIEAIHEAALNVLEDLGIKVLLPEARKMLAAGGATVDASAEMVFIGRDMVAAALESAP